MRKLIAFLCLFAATCFGQDYVLTDGTNFFDYIGQTNNFGLLRYNLSTLEQTSPGIVFKTKDGTPILGTRTNLYIVKTLTDFIDNAASYTNGIITLLPNSIYEINGSVIISTNRLVASQANRIEGRNAQSDQIISSSTSPMITASNVNLVLSEVTLVSVASDALCIRGNSAAPSNDVAVFNTTFANCLGWLDIGDCKTFTMIESYLQNPSVRGIQCSSTNSEQLAILDSLFDVKTFSGTVIDLSTSVWDVIEVGRNAFHFTNAAMVISGDTNSGNLVELTGRGFLSGNIFHNEGGESYYTNYISGLTPGDIGWWWNANPGVPFSSVIGAMFLTNTPQLVDILRSIPEPKNAYLPPLPIHK